MSSSKLLHRFISYLVITIFLFSAVGCGPDNTPTPVPGVGGTPSPGGEDSGAILTAGAVPTNTPLPTDTPQPTTTATALNKKIVITK